MKKEPQALEEFRPKRFEEEYKKMEKVMGLIEEEGESEEEQEKKVEAPVDEWNTVETGRRKKRGGRKE